MNKETPTGRPYHLLRMMYTQGDPVSIYTIQVKQSELAKQLQISRQALNVHLRKLRDLGCIRTGRGFIDVTEEGLNALWVSVNPAFIFIKISPLKREEAYHEISNFPIQQIFRVAGDMDAVLLVEQGTLNETLRRLALLEGIQETRSYVTIQTLK